MGENPFKNTIDNTKVSPKLEAEFSDLGAMFFVLETLFIRKKIKAGFEAIRSRWTPVSQSVVNDMMTMAQGVEEGKKIFEEIQKLAIDSGNISADEITPINLIAVFRKSVSNAKV